MRCLTTVAHSGSGPSRGPLLPGPVLLQLNTNWHRTRSRRLRPRLPVSGGKDAPPRPRAPLRLGRRRARRRSHLLRRVREIFAVASNVDRRQKKTSCYWAPWNLSTGSLPSGDHHSTLDHLLKYLRVVRLLSSDVAAVASHARRPFCRSGHL